MLRNSLIVGSAVGIGQMVLWRELNILELNSELEMRKRILNHPKCEDILNKYIAPLPFFEFDYKSTSFLKTCIEKDVESIETWKEKSFFLQLFGKPDFCEDMIIIKDMKRGVTIFD